MAGKWACIRKLKLQPRTSAVFVSVEKRCQSEVVLVSVVRFTHSPGFGLVLGDFLKGGVVWASD